MTTYTLSSSYLRQFAQSNNCANPAYGSDAYNNACAYNGSTQTTTGSGDGSNAGGNNPIDALANTGFDVLIPLFIGISLVGASGIYFLKQLHNRRKRP